ncbi:MAG: UDP-2,3-diacylglucosamine diphosphatase, partial [Psychrobium sp.]
SRFVPIYYINGNRDFLLSYAYAHRAGMKILPEVHTLSLYGKQTVILHGDTLCTLDVDYQKFRKFRNNSFVQWLFTGMPPFVRKAIAKKIRNKSKQSNKNKKRVIMDVEATAVQQLMKQKQATQMIHGHTHRPGFNQVSENMQRIVVGDWYDEGSVLEVSSNDAVLITLPF